MTARVWYTMCGTLRRRLVVLVLVSVLGGPLVSSCAPSDPDATVIRGVSVIDVESGTASPPWTLVVSGNRIVDAGPVADVRAPRGATVIEAEGLYAMPGLWDMHVHVLQDGVYERMFPMFIANGVTGVRDMNGPMPLADIHALRGRVLAGEVLGPRFLAPGPLLDGPGRGPDALGPMVRWVDTPEKARDTVRALAARGADFIKPYNRLTPELYEAVVDEARTIGIPVMGHVPLGVDAMVASEAGQASMEHLQGILEGTSTAGPALTAAMVQYIETVNAGRPLPPEVIRGVVGGRRAIVGTHDPGLAAALYASFVRNGNWQCVTLVSNRMANLIDVAEERAAYEADPRLRFIPEGAREEMTGVSFARGFGNPEEDFYRRRWAEVLNVVGEMYRAGVPILAGTDTGAAYTFAGFSLHDELALLVEAGLPPAGALRAATLGPAELLGATDSLGTVGAGKVADIVLLEANPLEDIANTRQIRAVIANGRIVDRPALDGLLAEAEAFAASEQATAGAVR